MQCIVCGFRVLDLDLIYSALEGTVTYWTFYRPLIVYICEKNLSSVFVVAVVLAFFVFEGRPL